MWIIKELIKDVKNKNETKEDRIIVLILLILLGTALLIGIITIVGILFCLITNRIEQTNTSNIFIPPFFWIKFI